MIAGYWLIVAFIAGMIFFAVMYRLYGNLTPEAQKELQESVCSHNYKLVNTTCTDALGQPYGYHHYECRRCGHKYKKFWYI